MEKTGLIHIYTGDGKGKTTAALGLAFRAAGHGFKIAIIQFMKSEELTTGEIQIIGRIPEIAIIQYPGNFIDDDMAIKDKKASLEKGIAKARELMGTDIDLMILDEINTAVSVDLLSEDAVLDLIGEKPQNLELVLTGRGAPASFAAKADYVTEMLNLKHPYEQDQPARRGIEF